MEIASMRMDKLTSRFQQALADAQSLAVGRDRIRWWSRVLGGDEPRPAQPHEPG
jgi:hypothetical protein